MLADADNTSLHFVNLIAAAGLATLQRIVAALATCVRYIA
jgi:hypothetical protein